MNDRICKCDNCAWTGPESELKPSEDFWQRVDSGDTVPAGDCPECGAFAFVVQPPKPDLHAALLECVTMPGALAWRSPRNAGRRLRAINQIVNEATKGQDDA